MKAKWAFRGLLKMQQKDSEQLLAASQAGRKEVQLNDLSADE